ncbi:glycosyltransferase family 4 protein [Arcobacter arenosus]|uniref:Glycosyltransferase family 4 protein n=1 Tax=Arcobacter arenosus TaxID=2576037 RepID=A0A5R8Y0K6_9BACT|nr:glycosyltransferase family 4 protein [Arcobacter arenosus]TLP37781.1 glycosyltransferase family 4 protein [Arcobacter arenosus]
MKVFWSLNVLENQLLDQIYAILINNSDITISIFPMNVNYEELSNHPLNQLDNFILLNRKNIKSYKSYIIKFILHLLFNQYDLIDTKMAQSKESYIVYLVSKIFRKNYLVNLYGKERYILDKNKNVTKKFSERVIKVLQNSIFHICNDKTLVEVSKYVGKENYLLYNAINFERFFSIKKENIVVPTIFYNHRLIPDKRPMVFFEAINILKNKNLTFKVIIVGSKRLESTLGEKVNSYINEKQLEKYIEWIDYRVDGNMMNKLYSQSDITVNISELIVPSLSTLEAMASGLSPIISNEIDSEKYVEDGKNGLIVNSNAEELADKLELIIQNKNLREEFGMESQKRVSLHFDINKWGKIYGDLYRYILDNGPLPKSFMEYEI